jgi:hypothetical protein
MRAAGRTSEFGPAGVDLPVLFPMPVAGAWEYDQVIGGFGTAAGSRDHAPRDETTGERTAP